MLRFSNLMLHQLHFHAVLRIDSENSFYEGPLVLLSVRHFLKHNVPLALLPLSLDYLLLIEGYAHTTDPA